MSPAQIAKLSTIGLLALLTAWLVVAVGIANISRSARPALALSLFPLDARAQAKAAEQLVQSRPMDSSARIQARRLATEALRRDPTVVPAWRTLAAIYGLEGDGRRAATLFHLSERMSRRDLMTQLWLIEESVARNDIPGALQHYDIALRTNIAARDLLFPILVRATADRQIIQPLAALLSQRPEWRRYFLAKLVEAPPSADNAVLLIERLAAAGPLDDREVLAPLAPRLVEMRAFVPAARVYRLLAGTNPQAALLRNGDFSRANALPPFDWALSAGVDVNADQGVVGDRPALQARASNGQGGVVARQLLMLSPGSYRLRWRAGQLDGTDPARLRWSVTCSAENGRELLRQPISNLDGRLEEALIQVPAGACSAQWLDLSILPDFNPGGVGAWVRGVAIGR